MSVTAPRASQPSPYGHSSTTASGRPKNDSRSGRGGRSQTLYSLNPFGQPLDPDGVSKKLKRIPTGAGLPADRPVHKLRRSCASVLIAHAVDELVVKEVLGHSQISLTLSIYAHLFPGEHRAAAMRSMRRSEPASGSSAPDR